MTQDRRRGSDRRSVPRYPVRIEMFWEGATGKQSGTISDISMLGCFVLCSGQVEDGERIKIYLPLARGRAVTLWGEVANHEYEIGFAMRFVELNENEEGFLERLIKKIIEV
jgi:hypothetical protein